MPAASHDALAARLPDFVGPAIDGAAVIFSVIDRVRRAVLLRIRQLGTDYAWLRARFQHHWKAEQ